MEIVLVILALLILGKTTKKDNKFSVRLIAGSVLGISYFIVWPYLFYIGDLLNWSETHIQISFVTMVAVFMLIARALIEIKFYELVQALSIVTFLVLWPLSSIFEITIKDKIADNAGFFTESLVSNLDKNEQLTKRISSPTNAYSVSVPDDWKEHIHTNTLLPFYRPEDAASSITEFRPRCNSKQNTSISKIVEGMASIHQEGQTSSYQCYHWNQHDYACWVKISDNTGITRIRWIGANKETSQLLDLDFVMKNGNQKDQTITESIFKTIKYNQTADKTANCVTPMEWF